MPSGNAATTNHAATRNITAAMNVVSLSALAGEPRSRIFMAPMPTSDAASPTTVMAIGSATALSRNSSPSAGLVAASATVAITAPT